MARKDDVPEIVQAAQVIEQELERLEALSRSVQNARLDSDKNIARAGRILEEAVKQQEQLGASLRTLAESMGRMQLRQQAAIEAIAARAQDVQRQWTLLTEHLERFAALGVKAAEATRLLQTQPPADEAEGEVATERDAAAGPAAGPATATLVDVEARLHALSDEAKALTRSAREAELADVAKDAESLRQRLDSARVRLSELVREAQQRAN